MGKIAKCELYDAVDLVTQFSVISSSIHHELQIVLVKTPVESVTHIIKTWFFMDDFQH